MTKGLYITSAEPYSGKTIMVLGLMEFLVGRIGRIGFFRPLIHNRRKVDPFISLIMSRYQMPQHQETMFGCTFGTARDLLVEDRQEDLYSLILEKYKTLEAQCDFVVCVGTDYTDAAISVELEFNMAMANHLGIPMLPVLKGKDKPVSHILESTQVIVNLLRDHRCDILAVVITHVPPDNREGMLFVLGQVFKDDFPIYAIAEDPRLQKPTIGEVAESIDAVLVSGSEDLYDGLVRSIKIAAMELPNFLEQIEEGCMIITPGDRSDIILGVLAAELSGLYPHIVGLILTGKSKPAPNIQQLVECLGAKTLPVFAVNEDTFSTAIAADAVECCIGPRDQRKIAAALGLVESSVNLHEIVDRVSLAPSEHITPLMFQYELIQRAQGKRKHIVLPEGMEERVLRAAEIALFRDICDITLLGNEQDIRRKISSLGLSLEKANVIDPNTSELREPFTEAYYELRKHKGINKQMAYETMSDWGFFGTMMAHLGYADGMVSGAIHTTAATIRPAFQIIKTQPGISIVSSVFFMCLEDQVLVYGDCAINPDPSAEQLADIAINSALTAQTFGIEPRVAMLSYSTGESGQGPEVDKVREATRMAQERRPDLKIEGPLQYDAAIDIDVAKLKSPDSKVAGHATVFIFPDLNAGNNAYKAVQRAAGAVAIGPVLQGLNKPVNDLSRGALVPDIVNTIAITAIQAQL
ncbi:MAG: phosphate acetyltransferase [Candidatus Methylumidiphilus sp.]